MISPRVPALTDHDRYRIVTATLIADRSERRRQLSRRRVTMPYSDTSRGRRQRRLARTRRDRTLDRRRPATATDRIRIDPSVVRGLEYYTGPVYEVELLLETKDEKGRPVRFGSVGGGGRYDGLVSRFRGEPVPATGFSIGVSRLQAALTMIGKLDIKARARAGRRHGVRRRHRALPEDGRDAAQRRHPRRDVSRQPEAQSRPADEIRRPARLAVRDHPGLERTREGRGPDQGPDPRRDADRRSRTATSI